MSKRKMYWCAFWWSFFHPFASELEELEYAEKLVMDFEVSNGK